MTLTKKYWRCFALFIGIQVLVIYSIIRRENNYVTHLYKLQKLEQMQAQLSGEYGVLQNELQKNKNLASLKEYAQESLHLQQLPLTAFRHLYDDDSL